MDGTTIKIGYGNGSSFRDGHPTNRNAPGSPAQKRNSGPKVDIFNGDEYIRSIPLKILTRFSEAAKRDFPRPGRQGTTQATSSKEAPALTSSKVDSILDWAEEVNAADGGAAAGAQAAKKETPSEQKSRARDRLPVIAPISLAYAIPKAPKKTLVLKLDVVEMPSKKALGVALKWMEDNESSEGKLIDFGPVNLDKIKLDDLIDLYQAALAFELRPWGKVGRLQREICHRVSEGKLEISTFKLLSGWLPGDDQVLVRCANSMEYHRRKSAYNVTEMEEVAAFLQQPSNKKLDATFADVLGEWRMRREARQSERSGRRQDQISKVIDGTDYGTKSSGGVEEEATTSNTIDKGVDTVQQKEGKPTTRRRNRRTQKAKGEAKQGQDAAGAK